MKKLKLDELGRLSVGDYKAAVKLPVCIVLDNIRSLHNVGSVFRTGDAFRVEKIILTGITGCPPHREIHKTALGSTESVEWEYSEDAVARIQDLSSSGYRIIVVEQTDASIPLQDFKVDPGQKYCLVFGNEINGVSEPVVQHADAAIEIPQQGTKHSLNVSVCAGIVIWHVARSLVSASGERL